MAEQIPGAGLPEGINLVRGTYNLWVLRMELVSYQPPGILNFELTPRFSENLCTPADALSQRLHRHMQLTNKIKKKLVCKKCIYSENVIHNSCTWILV